MNIYCASPKRQYLEYASEIKDAINQVLESGNYILGPRVKSFEQGFADYIGAEYAIGVNSGTDALIIALKALGCEYGDEVITVSHTALPTISAVLQAGCKPVVVDIEEDYFTIQCDQIERSITTKTKAIIAVHLYGQSADLDSLLHISKKYKIPIIEDCAQAIGTEFQQKKVGSFGDIGTFSFYPTKNLGAIGDAGMVVTNQADIANRIKEIRQYGWDSNRETKCIGINSRIDELQASILEVKLKYIENDIKKRQLAASFYDQKLLNGQIILPQKRGNTIHSYHLYVIRCPKRNELKQYLASQGIFADIHYPIPVHMQNIYKDELVVLSGDLTVTESVCNDILSLPIFPEITEEELSRISDAVLSFY